MVQRFFGGCLHFLWCCCGHLCINFSVEHKIAAGGIAHRADPDATSKAPEIKPYHGRAVEARESIHQSEAIARTQVYKGLDRATDREVSTQMPIDGGSPDLPTQPYRARSLNRDPGRVLG